MKARLSRLCVICLLVLAAPDSEAHPGGTPNFQTDVLPYCAVCHSSTAESDLEGTGERSLKELAEQKHLALIAAGEKGYGELDPNDRAALIAQIRAVDANSTIEIEYPPQVGAGESFQVAVRLTGGAGPVVGIALLDRPHRWYARSAATIWSMVGAPSVIGPDGQPQSEWLDRRPELKGRSISFLNVTGVESNAAAGSWASSKVIFTLRAPQKPGDYPLVGAYFYGTEKASPFGYKTDALGRKQVRGTYTGSSGRVKFTDRHVITVK